MICYYLYGILGYRFKLYLITDNYEAKFLFIYLCAHFTKEAEKIVLL
jgi:hypothetical protein